VVSGSVAPGLRLEHKQQHDAVTFLLSTNPSSFLFKNRPQQRGKVTIMSKYSKGWYYRWDYNYPLDYCHDDALAQVTAYSLGKCLYDPVFGSYVNVTCDSRFAYVARYQSGQCTGPFTTALQTLACEATFGAYFGCTPSTDWTTVIPTNGAYGIQQYFPTTNQCEANNPKVDLANSSMVYMFGRINGTCVPEYVDKSERLLFPVESTYTTSATCSAEPSSVQTWPLICTADTQGRYYTSAIVG
jgi:hypothetical protein